MLDVSLNTFVKVEITFLREKVIPPSVSPPQPPLEALVALIELGDIFYLNV